MLIVLVTFDEELHSSVAVDAGVNPPKASAADVSPAPGNAYRAVLKSATSTHETPFQSSVFAKEGGPSPPKANAEV